MELPSLNTVGRLGPSSTGAGNLYAGLVTVDATRGAVVPDATVTVGKSVGIGTAVDSPGVEEAAGFALDPIVALGPAVDSGVEVTTTTVPEVAANGGVGFGFVEQPAIRTIAASKMKEYFTGIMV